MKKKIAEEGGPIRVQKFLSDAGVASRREAEELIRDGFVMINDEIVDTLPAFVDPERDVITVRGRRVRPRAPIYLMLNKPKNVVCTSGPKAGRLRVVDLLPPDLDATPQPVGRLDPEACGLVLMTTDGELAQRVAHPRYEIAKRYSVEVRARVTPEHVAQMARGVHLAEGKARAEAIEIVDTRMDRTILEMTVYDEIPRMIQRMLAKFGFEVHTLKRLSIGPLVLKGLADGALRSLTPVELARLIEVVKSARRGKSRTRRAGTAKAREAREAVKKSRVAGAAESSGMPPRGGEIRGPSPRGGGKRSESGKGGTGGPTRRIVT
ncbi:MAG: pseudouridine synthase [Phycisphaerae bacterium]|nr:pseudouridine synthase [Phycisphaerae bacterium]